MAAHAVQQISECFVKPKYETAESKLPHYLSAWDLAMLAVQYIQKGILFAKPSEAYDGRQFMESLFERLKDSLSVALVHFYPLAGRLTTILNGSESSCLVFVDCNGSPGAKFIHSTLDMTILEILSPPDVPLLVQSFFDHDRAANHDGHTRPLVSIQVTELLDGVFIGCSMNHAIGDGTTFWNFFNAWSEIFHAKGDDKPISRLPIVNRWFPEGHGPKIYLPFTRADEFVSRFEAPPLRERMFHVSSQSIAKIKRKANSEYNTQKISSFQSLSALLWRCITRARIQTRRLKLDQSTNCKLAINNRTRLEPPLPEDYFGNCIQTVSGVTTAGELLEHDLGWTAWMLHQAVANHNDKTVRDMVDKWIQSPSVYQIAQFIDPESVMMGSSPRFNMYGNEFGMGKGVALRSGYAHKFDGTVTSYPGYEGGGSIDLEICLPPDSMKVLESDQEFIEAVSLPHYLLHVVGWAPDPIPIADRSDGGADIQWNYGLEPKKRRRREQDFLAINSPISSLDFMQVRSVSTGLGLSLDNTLVTASVNSASMSLIGEEINCQLQRHDAETSRLVKTHVLVSSKSYGDRLRQTILDKVQVSQLQTISFMEERINLQTGRNGTCMELLEWAMQGDVTNLKPGCFSHDQVVMTTASS